MARCKSGLRIALRGYMNNPLSKTFAAFGRQSVCREAVLFPLWLWDTDVKVTGNELLLYLSLTQSNLLLDWRFVHQARLR